MQPPFPDRPPRVFATHADGSAPIAGTMEYCNWEGVTPGLVTEHRTTITWPEPVPRDGRRRIELHTPFSPCDIRVTVGDSVHPEKGWIGRTRVVTDALGHMGDSYSVEDLPREKRCPEAVDGVVAFDGLSAREFADEYITLMVTWATPYGIDSQRRRHYRFCVNASWMFHFSNPEGARAYAGDARTHLCAVLPQLATQWWHRSEV